jgi:hypothetical protein
VGLVATISSTSEVMACGEILRLVVQETLIPDNMVLSVPGGH